MFGMEYKKVGIQAVYIAGTHGNGNVLFTWLYWELPDFTDFRFLGGTMRKRPAVFRLPSFSK